MKVLYKKSELLHQNAYNEYGTLVNIQEAEKILEGKKNKFFLYSDFTFEVILKNGDVNRKHFALKSEINIDGVKYNAIDINGESVQHYEAKVKIARNLYFLWSNYRIHFTNPKIEKVLEDSKYRADLVAELLCGTKIAIEIVYTSEISESKIKFIREKQIPTFIIYIEKNGHQNFERFDFIGNGSIEQLSKRIRKGKDAVGSIVKQRDKRERELFRETENYRKKLREIGIESKQETISSPEDGFISGNESIKQSIISIKGNIESRRSEIDQIVQSKRSIEIEIENNFVDEAKIESNRKLLKFKRGW